MRMIKHILVFGLLYITELSSVYANSTTLIPQSGDESGLAEKFQRGTLELYDIPTYIKYLTEQFVWIAGLVAVIMIVIGGYSYMYNEDKGKRILKNVILYGLPTVVFAWMIVDLLIRLVTE